MKTEPKKSLIIVRELKLFWQDIDSSFNGIIKTGVNCNLKCKILKFFYLNALDARSVFEKPETTRKVEAEYFSFEENL